MTWTIVTVGCLTFLLGAALGAWLGWDYRGYSEKADKLKKPCPASCPLSGETEEAKRVREEQENAEAWRRMQNYSVRDAYGGESG